MPKTIEYPRTSYASAWEVAEVVDDTGGKCAIDTCARKLNRKVSGSFKAIIGSAVKFGLVTSKRELLTTTNLFRRIKHAYDKQEEKVYHREAFLHPPLFTQICRKFRSRELPVHMLDVMLIREFGVEEINAQNVANAFVEGARRVGVMDERNVVADIDQLAAQQPPRRELASTEMPLNLFRGVTTDTAASSTTPETGTVQKPHEAGARAQPDSNKSGSDFVPRASVKDAVSALFGLDTEDLEDETAQMPPNQPLATPILPSQEQGLESTNSPVATRNTAILSAPAVGNAGAAAAVPVQALDDVEIVRILLEKIRGQLAG